MSSPSGHTRERASLAVRQNFIRAAQQIVNEARGQPVATRVHADLRALES
jgi:hypothetical protein